MEIILLLLCPVFVTAVIVAVMAGIMWARRKK